MKKTIVVIISILLSFLQLSAQDPYLDSLNTALKKAKHDSIIIGLNYKIGQFFSLQNSDTCMIFFNNALETCDKNLKNFKNQDGKTTGEILVLKTDVLQSAGVYYNNTGVYDMAGKYFLKSLIINKVLEKLPDSSLSHQGRLGKSVANMNLGNVYYYQGVYDKALEHYQNTLKYYEEIIQKGDESKVPPAKRSMGMVCSNIGGVYYNLKTYDKSIEYHQRALKAFTELDFNRGIAYSYNNLGLVYYQFGIEEPETIKRFEHLDKALDFQQKSLDLKLPLGDKKGVSGCYNNIALVYVDQGNILKDINEKNDKYKKAIEYSLKALALFEELNDVNAMAMVYGNLSYLYVNLSGIESGSQKNPAFLKDAVLNGEKGLIMAQKINANQLVCDISKHLQLAWKYLGDFKKAHYYLELHMASRDTMFNEEKTRALAEMETKYVTEKKQLQIEKLENEKLLQNETIARKEAETRKQRIIIYFSVAGLLALLLLVFMIFRLFLMKKKANRILTTYNQEILQKNEEIATQRDEIAAQRDLATNQRDIIAKQQKDIKDSIRYAFQIQSALFPTDEDLRLILKDYFIFYRPRDIVSGDFYWVNKFGNKIIIVASDCTGHGVPGAFMSMLGIAFLNEIVSKENITNPAQILNRLRENIILAMKQHGENVKQQDGMDAVAITIDRQAGTLDFAGANNPLYIVTGGLSLVTGDANQQPATSNQQLIELKGDKMPVSIYARMQPFTNHTIPIDDGDLIYIFSDG